MRDRLYLGHHRCLGHPELSLSCRRPTMYVFLSQSSPALLCVFITCAFLLFFMHRTRMIQLRSLGTKGLCSPRPQLKGSCRQTMRPETPWPPRKPRGRRDITVCLPSDFALMNHRSHRCPAWTVLLRPTSLKSSQN